MILSSRAKITRSHLRVAADSTLTPPAKSRRFRVALSFPGEHRPRVEKIAEALAVPLRRDEILYDRWYDAEFAKPHLGVSLPKLYRDESHLSVVFLCKEYEKDWCGLEWRALLDLIKRKEYDRLMLLRLDGIRPKAREHFAKADTLVQETGYHRRDPDLAELRPLCT